MLLNIEKYDIINCLEHCLDSCIFGGQMKFFSKLKSNMSFNIIVAIIILLAMFGFVLSALSMIGFTNTYKNGYSRTTYHIADSAASLVNGDHLDLYLNDELEQEYESTRRYMDVFCKKIHVTLIYVIKVDTSDYNSFVSVFNCVNNTVDNTNYTPWEKGFERKTSTDEYKEKYQAIYNKQSDYETVYRIKTTDGQKPHVTSMVPICNSKGDVTGILCVQRPAREVNKTLRPYILLIVISTLVLAIIASLIAIWFIRTRILKPVRRVSEEANRFADTKIKAEPLGKISGYQELAALSASIDTMETDMVNYMNNLADVTAERQRISTELNLAKTIQASAIPSVFPAFPDRTDFDIYGSMDPAKEVGGDFYNFRLIDDDHLMMVIGDVSGKGIPAALFMMVTNILISDRTTMGYTPGEIMTIVNSNLCEHNKAEMFVTIWLGILDLSTGKLISTNAGHEDVAICRKDGKFELMKTKHGLVSGVMEGVKYKDIEDVLRPGDKLFVYTDGVPEATNANEELFGLERMTEALNEVKDRNPQGILEGVHRRINTFVGDAPQFDDLTMLCIEFFGKK